MSENKQHPYAEILRAIADGKEVQSEWEGIWADESHSITLQQIALKKVNPDRLRIKPKTIRIGEFDVPEPLRVAPVIGTEHWVVALPDAFGSCWDGQDLDVDRLHQGRIHQSKGAAELHAKALISLTAQK